MAFNLSIHKLYNVHVQAVITVFLENLFQRYQWQLHVAMTSPSFVFCYLVALSCPHFCPI